MFRFGVILACVMASFHWAEGQSCDVTVTQTAPGQCGIITSPGWPFHYEPFHDCDYNFNPLPGYLTKLTFLNYYVEQSLSSCAGAPNVCPYDWIEVAGSTTRWCGAIPNCFVTNYARFRTDFRCQFQGFRFRYCFLQTNFFRGKTTQPRAVSICGRLGLRWIYNTRTLNDFNAAVREALRKHGRNEPWIWTAMRTNVKNGRPLRFSDFTRRGSRCVAAKTVGSGARAGVTLHSRPCNSQAQTLCNNESCNTNDLLRATRCCGQSICPGRPLSPVTI